MVSDSNDDGRVSYDVIYDENSPSRKANEDLDAAAEEEDDDEEDGVEADRVVPVSISPCLSCAARLNLARCWFRKGKHNEVNKCRCGQKPSAKCRYSTYPLLLFLFEMKRVILAY